MKQSKTFEKRGWGGGDKWGIGERQIWVICDVIAGAWG